MPPSWNQPFLDGRVDSDLFNGDAVSYEGRPTVKRPHAVHFMGMLPAARRRHMAAVAAALQSANDIGGLMLWRGPVSEPE